MSETQEQAQPSMGDNDLAREHEERRQRRGKTDVNYGASEDQVPAEGWVT